MAMYIKLYARSFLGKCHSAVQHQELFLQSSRILVKVSQALAVGLHLYPCPKYRVRCFTFRLILHVSSHFILQMIFLKTS